MKQTALTTSQEHTERTLLIILRTIRNLLLATFRFFWMVITKLTSAISAGFFIFADMVTRFSRPPTS